MYLNDLNSNKKNVNSWSLMPHLQMKLFCDEEPTKKHEN